MSRNLIKKPATVQAEHQVNETYFLEPKSK